MIMRRKCYLLLMIVMIMLVSTGCNTPSNGPNVIEFKSTGGKYRVTAPAGWKLSEEMMGYSSVLSANKDINFLVMMVDPPKGTLDLMPNPRNFTANERKIVLMDQLKTGTASSTIDGVTFKSSDALNGLVTIGAHSYLVALAPATTVKVDDALIKTFVDMLGTLEPIGS
jgi:hypothetical protein